ncbi:MAG: hypothetical protein Q8P51_11610 [Ignavibacteria bacterium]|nr:hypothetical protein [Ignavibacteria bacterium]
MDKKQFLKLTENPDFIRGIFNYCDRWCERCGFTRRCSVYAAEREAFPEQEARDQANERFWERVHETFELTLELLRDAARERGVDLTAEVPGDQKGNQEARKHDVRENPLVKGARDYSDMVSQWLTAHEDGFEEEGRKMRMEEELGIGDPHLAASAILDAVEVIRWYQYQIMVKLMRALNSEELNMDSETNQEIDEFPKDSDGSAKVALIGIDRSIGAWGTLRYHFESATDSITHTLVYLDRLRSDIEARFPEARRFVRSGFDQEILH